MPWPLERPGVEEVELVVAEAPCCEGRIGLSQVRRGARMRHVESQKALVPVPARVGARDEPFRMLGSEGAPLADQEGRGPDARDLPGSADALRRAPKRAEARVVSEPVADPGLVAVVHLHDLDRELEPPGCVQVLEDGRLGDVAEAARPRAPAGRDGADLAWREALSEGCQRLLEVALEAELEDWAVCGHVQATRPRLDANRGDLASRLGRVPDANGLTRGGHGQNPLALEPAPGKHLLRTPAHRVRAAIRWARRRRARPVHAGRAP